MFARTMAVLSNGDVDVFLTNHSPSELEQSICQDRQKIQLLNQKIDELTDDLNKIVETLRINTHDRILNERYAQLATKLDLLTKEKQELEEKLEKNTSKLTKLMQKTSGANRRNDGSIGSSGSEFPSSAQQPPTTLLQNENVQDKLSQLITVFLPDNQITCIPAKPINKELPIPTIREALDRKLKLRNINSDVCALQYENGQQVPWIVKTDVLAGSTLYVKQFMLIPPHTWTKLKLVFFANCNNCGRRLFGSAGPVQCTKCRIAMHKECVPSAAFCVPLGAAHANQLISSQASQPADSATRTLSARPTSGSVTSTSSSLMGAAQTLTPSFEHHRQVVSSRDGSSDAKQNQVIPTSMSQSKIYQRTRSPSNERAYQVQATPSELIDDTSAATTVASRTSSVHQPHQPSSGSNTPRQAHSGRAAQLTKQHNLLQPSAGSGPRRERLYSDSKPLIVNATAASSSPQQPANGAQRLAQEQLQQHQQVAAGVAASVGSNHRHSSSLLRNEMGDIHIGHRVGSGSFGTVYKGEWFGEVAVKILNVANPTKDQLSDFKNEVNMLRKTRHQNILLFMGCIEQPHLAIVTQWCDGLSLYRHLHVEDRFFTMTTIVDIAKQTAQGLEYLHAKGIIHRDVKSNNIFLTDSIANYCTVKIGDFGLAAVKTRPADIEGQKQQVQRQIKLQPTGSILWMAPEIIRMRDDQPFSQLSDVYSYGVVLFELLTNQLPYPNIKFKEQLLYMIGKGMLTPDWEQCRPDSPHQLKHLAKICSSYDRTKRPTFKSIVSRLNSITVAGLERSLSDSALSSR